jgi:hypothetical protein
VPKNKKTKTGIYHPPKSGMPYLVVTVSPEGISATAVETKEEARILRRGAPSRPSGDQFGWLGTTSPRGAKHLLARGRRYRRKDFCISSIAFTSCSIAFAISSSFSFGSFVPRAAWACRLASIVALINCLLDLIRALPARCVDRVA